MDSRSEKPLRHFNCVVVTYQACDFNKLLPDFKEIRPDKLPKNPTKNNLYHI